MRRLIAVIALVGGLLAVAGPAQSQIVPPASPGGAADPLQLAASGVLMPFFGAPGEVALLEISSPVGPNPGLHMFYFDANCARVGPSDFLPLTTNDVGFRQVVGNGNPFGNPGGGFLDSFGFFGLAPDKVGGLIAIAQSADGFTMAPLDPGSPIHSRMYIFNPANGRSRVIEPIILDAAEYPGNPHLWSPLRTEATFFSPQEGFVFPNGGVLRNALALICPKSTIVGAPYLSPTVDPATGGGGFPAMLPAFPSAFSSDVANGSLRAIVFDADEKPLKDIHTGCNCVSVISPLTALDPVYATAAAVFGTYTKIQSNFIASALTTGGGLPNHLFAFTGYKTTSSGPVNDFFFRLSDGSYATIDAVVPGGVFTGQR